MRRILTITRSDASHRHERWINVMVWAAGEDHAFLGAESFRSIAELGTWLTGERTRHPGLSVVWTESLLADGGLASAVAAILAVPLPPKASMAAAPGRER
jgi:hypothetical protein